MGSAAIFSSALLIISVKKVDMWWLTGSTPDFWGRGLGFESGISPSMILMRHAGSLDNNVGNLRVERNPTPEAKKILKKKKMKTPMFQRLFSSYLRDNLTRFSMAANDFNGEGLGP